MHLSVRAYAPTRSLKLHPRGAAPGPRLKLGSVFVASGGAVAYRDNRQPENPDTPEMSPTGKRHRRFFDFRLSGIKGV